MRFSEFELLSTMLNWYRNYVDSGCEAHRDEKLDITQCAMDLKLDGMGK